MSTPSKPMALPFTEAEIEKYRADVAESESVYIANEGHLSESYGTMIREYERWLATVDALRAEAQEQFNIRQAAQADYVKAADALEEAESKIDELTAERDQLRAGLRCEIERMEIEINALKAENEHLRRQTAHSDHEWAVENELEEAERKIVELQSRLDRIVEYLNSCTDWAPDIWEIKRIATGEK